MEPSDDLNDSELASSVSARKPNGTFMGLIRRTSQNVGTSLATTMGGYLPKGVTEMWEPARDFAWIKIPKANNSSTSGSLRSVVAMSSNTPQVMVVTSEGNFYRFSIDLIKGGEGALIKQYSYVNARPQHLLLADSSDRVLDTDDKVGSSTMDY